MSLQDIRNKFPQYDDISDGDLAYKLYAKSYSDMPMGQFADQINLSRDEFSFMIASARKAGYSPTSRTQSKDRVIEDLNGTGILRSAIQTATFGGADEMVGGGAALGRKLMGDERPIGEIYTQEQQAEEARLNQYRKTDPVKAGIAEFAGGMVAPLGVVKNAKQALAAGAGVGGLTGFLSGENGNRLKSAGYGALFGGLLGPAAYKGGELAASSFGKALQNRAKKLATAGAPTASQLKKEADEAYQIAKDSGVVIDPDQFNSFVDSVIKSVSGKSRVQQEAVDTLMPKMKTVKNMLEGSVGEQLGLDDLEALRRIAKIPAGDITNPDQQRMAMTIVNAIDDLMENIDPKQMQGDLFQKQLKEFVGGAFKDARSMWGKLRKTEQIDELLLNAGTYAGGLESGIKNQLNSILRNPRKQRNFTKAELKMMREISEGTPLGNLAGSVSQMGLSATGGRNVLSAGTGMAAGGIGGFVIGGPVGAAIGAGAELTAATALKYVREKSMEQQVKILRDLIASGQVDKFANQAPEAFAVIQQAVQKIGQSTIINNTPELQRTQPRGLLSQ